MGVVSMVVSAFVECNGCIKRSRRIVLYYAASSYSFFKAQRMLCHTIRSDTLSCVFKQSAPSDSAPSAYCHATSLHSQLEPRLERRRSSTSGQAARLRSRYSLLHGAAASPVLHELAPFQSQAASTSPFFPGAAMNATAIGDTPAFNARLCLRASNIARPAPIRHNPASIRNVYLKQDLFPKHPLSSSMAAVISATLS